MLKKIAAVAGGVLIGLAIAFARAGAFPFWGSDSDASKAPPPAAASTGESGGAAAGAAGARRSRGSGRSARGAEYP